MIQITGRERLLAIGLIAVVGVWALYALAIKPTRARIRTLQRIIPEKQAELHDLQAKSADYLARQRSYQQLQTKLASQGRDFQLLPFLETMIEQHKLTRHVVTMQQNVSQPQPDYSEVVVTLDLQDVTLRQLVNFLAAVESSDAVVLIASLHIRKDPTNEAVLDSTVGICSPQPSPHAPAPLAQSR